MSKLTATGFVHPLTTGKQDAFEIFACGLKLKAIGFKQPKTTGIQFKV